MYLSVRGLTLALCHKVLMTLLDVIRTDWEFFITVLGAKGQWGRSASAWKHKEQPRQ